MAAFIAVWRIERTAPGFPDDGLARGLAQELGIHHRVRVLRRPPRVAMPDDVSGFLRPAVFMPPEAAAWSEERRRIVLLHELATCAGADAGTHLLARTALSPQLVEPAAWSAWREFLKERERATDDLVLNAGARASDYAGHLLEVARTMQSARATAWRRWPWRGGRSFKAGWRAILDSGVKRHAPGRAARCRHAAGVAAVAPFPPCGHRRPVRQTTPSPSPVEFSARQARTTPWDSVKLGEQHASRATSRGTRLLQQAVAGAGRPA